MMKAPTTPWGSSREFENPALEFENFDRIVEGYRPRVLRFLFASLRDMDLAETLAQDCFWNAYRSREKFRGDCSMNTWLMRIAVNLLRNHVQSRRFQFWKRTHQVDSREILNWPDRGISPEASAVIQQQVQEVWEATKTLSHNQRTVFLLRYVEELDISEIARATALTENAVNVHLFRAVRSIRKRLGGSL